MSTPSKAAGSVPLGTFVRCSVAALGVRAGDMESTRLVSWRPVGHGHGGTLQNCVYGVQAPEKSERESQERPEHPERRPGKVWPRSSLRNLRVSP